MALLMAQELTLIEDLETFLKNTLQGGLQAERVSVSEFPDPGSAPRPKTAKRSFVGFVGKQNTDPEPASLAMVDHPLLQDSVLLFDVSVHVQDLRTHQGAYRLLMLIERLVTGAAPLEYDPTCRFWVKDIRYQNLEASIWTYLASVAINSPSLF